MCVAKYGGQLCPYLNLTNNKPVTYKRFGKRFKLLVLASRLSKKLTPHCMRVEGAIFYAFQGWSDLEIQRYVIWSGIPVV